MVSLFFTAETENGREIITELAKKKPEGMSFKDRLALNKLTERTIVDREPLVLKFRIKTFGLPTRVDSDAVLQIKEGILQHFHEFGLRDEDYTLEVKEGE